MNQAQGKQLTSSNPNSDYVTAPCVLYTKDKSTNSHSHIPTVMRGPGGPHNEAINNTLSLTRTHFTAQTRTNTKKKTRTIYNL